SSLSVPRVISNGCACALRPPNCTPSELTICVSPGLVTIENLAPQEGQPKNTPSDPSPGFSTFSKFMYVSQLRHTNFMAAPLRSQLLREDSLVVQQGSDPSCDVLIALNGRIGLVQQRLPLVERARQRAVEWD